MAPKITSSEVVTGPKFNKTNRGRCNKAKPSGSSIHQNAPSSSLSSLPLRPQTNKFARIRKTALSNRAKRVRDAFQPYALSDAKNKSRTVVKGVATAINLQQRNIRRAAPRFIKRRAEWITRAAPALCSSIRLLATRCDGGWPGVDFCFYCVREQRARIVRWCLAHNAQPPHYMRAGKNKTKVFSLSLQWFMLSSWVCVQLMKDLSICARSSTRKRYARIDTAHCAPPGGAHMHVLFAISARNIYEWEREREFNGQTAPYRTLMLRICVAIRLIYADFCMRICDGMFKMSMLLGGESVRAVVGFYSRL